MLWGDDRFDDGSQIVNVWQRFNTEENIVEGGFSSSCIFRTSDNCKSCISLVERALRI